jgi:putative molybdopterin biosynthesis protein
MWAERQAQARLAPQIEALRSDLERAFAVAFDPHAHVVTLYASHDEALSILREHATAGDATGHDTEQIHLDIRFCGSVDAIRALNEGRCVMAGFHTLQHPRPGSLAEQVYKPLLQPGLHKIIGFAERTQGLMVAAGNPLQLHTLADVQRTQARFVNRALGTGTRVVIDELLALSHIPASGIAGYDRVEPSHVAAANAVASGVADVALGIAIAAQSQGLEFVPLVQENYHLVCLKSALQEPAIEALLALLQSPGWQSTLAQIAGYKPARSGQVLSLREVLSWWSFTKPRSGKVR